MFSQVRRQASKPQLTSMAAGPRRRRPLAALLSADRPFVRRVIGTFAVVALSVGGGIAAAAPSSGAEPEESYIVVLKDTVVDVGATAAAQQGAYGFATSQLYSSAVNGYAATMTASQAQRLQADPGVEFVTQGRKFHKPPDSEAPSTQVKPLWRQRISGTGPDAKNSLIRDGGGSEPVDVNVAVIDSGIDSTHPDLNVRGGIDCTSGSPVAVTPIDVLGHGTFVAGVIGARNNGFGVVGTAPGTPLWSVRVVDDAEGISEASLICAIDWVTSTHKDKDKTNDIAVANISIAGPGADTANCGKGTDPMHYAICRSVKAGVTYTVAAGNSSVDFAGTVPATYDQVITATAIGDFDGQPGGLAAPVCGAVDWTKFGQHDDAPAFFSNFATLASDKAHTVAGPGACILSTVPGGYNVMHGTSFASPAVAGSVALCISRNACKGSGKDVMDKYLDLTAGYSKKNHDFGFNGDPVHPIAGHYYGYLTEVASF